MEMAEALKTLEVDNKQQEVDDLQEVGVHSMEDHVVVEWEEVMEVVPSCFKIVVFIVIQLIIIHHHHQDQCSHTKINFHIEVECVVMLHLDIHMYLVYQWEVIMNLHSCLEMMDLAAEAVDEVVEVAPWVVDAEVVEVEEVAVVLAIRVHLRMRELMIMEIAATIID
jgi:hypothetical protein